MTVPDYYLQKDNWPHRFTKNGAEKLVGMTPDGKGIFGQPMICTSCYLEFMARQDPKPVGRCPARNDKQEYKRLGIEQR